MNYKISVIIPVYNVEEYLRRCLDSVINQTYKNLEIICINDGSKDKSGNICDEYSDKDKRIIVIHKTNGGLSSARNEGLQICTGDYISFIDSDDWIEEDFYEFVIKNVADEDLMVFDYYIAKSNTEKEIKKYGNKICEINKEKCLIDLSRAKLESHVWDKIYKSLIFKDMRFPENRNYEDQAIMHLIIDKSKKIKYFNESFYNYFQNPKSIVHTINHKNYRDFLYVNILRGRFLKERYPLAYEYHLNYVYSGIAKLCWVYQTDKNYTKRYKFLRKFILNRLKNNILNKKITLSTRVKMFLCVFDINIIKLLYR